VVFFNPGINFRVSSANVNVRPPYTHHHHHHQFNPSQEITNNLFSPTLGPTFSPVQYKPERGHQRVPDFVPSRQQTGKKVGQGSMKKNTTMAQAVTLLTALRMFTNARTSCNNGYGVTTYERYPGYHLQGDAADDVIRLSSSPETVMSKCVESCTVDRTPTNNLVRTCNSFTFQSGKFREGRWEESSCLLSRERPAPDGFAVLTNSQKNNKLTEYFNEICLKTENLADHCGNKSYAFTVYQDMDFTAPDFKRVTVNSRQACMDSCIGEKTFICRSAVYETLTRVCKMTRFVKPRGLAKNAAISTRKGNFYMENNCVHGLSRCDGYTMFLKEANAELRGGRDMARVEGATLSECERLCRDDSGTLAFECRSFLYNSEKAECVLSKDDSYSVPDNLVTSPITDFYEMVCIEGAQPEGAENKDLSYLYGREDRYYEEAVPFQRYRNSIIRAEFQRSIRNIDLGRCLDECLHQTSSKCLSVAYNPIDRKCKISQYDQKDSRILYDADYDYYENLVDNMAAPSQLVHTAIRFPSGHAHHQTIHLNLTEQPEAPPEPQKAYLPPLVGPPVKTLLPDASFRTPENEIAGSSNSARGGYYDNYHGAYRPPPGNEQPIFDPNEPQTGPRPNRYRPDSGDSIRFEKDNRPSYGASGGRRGRCDSGSTAGDTFRQVRSRTRLRQQFIKRLETVNSLYECEQECLNERTFKCLSFNYMSTSGYSYRSNCELSNREGFELDTYDFDQANQWDFYGREGTGGGCLDVSQNCDEDGMEFTMRIPEGFRGRIYTHKHYGRSQCYVRGTGGKTYTLRIPGVNGFPDCGTEKYGDTMTNIVVVQFAQDIQTNMDMKYNLTCTTRGPGSAVVTSGYIGAGSGQPVPIEYLPAEHTLDSRVRLLIKYQGRPTTTIAVGDPLEFKLETQDGENLLRDIFASNVIAKDPYSDRIVQLIDADGCPVDPYVFPALGLSRANDGLETGFNAFKIPESNFLVFEATVRSCRSGCRPATCSGPSGRDNSFGRKRRFADLEDDRQRREADDESSKVEIREMFRVYESRESIPDGETEIITAKHTVEEVCLTAVAYHGMIGAIVIVFMLLLLFAIIAGICFRKSRIIGLKNKLADSQSSSTSYLANSGPFTARAPSQHQHHGHNSRYPGPTNNFTTKQTNRIQQQRYLPNHDMETGEEEDLPSIKNSRRAYPDPSEPIYTDPSLFERY